MRGSHIRTSSNIDPTLTAPLSKSPKHTMERQKEHKKSKAMTKKTDRPCTIYQGLSDLIQKF